MRTDRLTKALLGIAVALFLLNLIYTFSGSARAEKEQPPVERYQITSWGAQMGNGYTRNGYYIVDTVTGRIIDSKTESHEAGYLPDAGGTSGSR